MVRIIRAKADSNVSPDTKGHESQSTSAIDPASVWVVIAAFNEAQIIGEVLDDLAETGHTLVVVDDGSSDGTWRQVANRPVHFLRHSMNLGQGAALQTGIDYALQNGARYLVTFDADGQHPPRDIPALLEPLFKGECQVTLGTRFRNQLTAKNIPVLRRWTLRTAVWLDRWRLGLKVTDTHNGFRAFTAEAALQIHITHNGMAHASEILEIIAREKLEWREVDVLIEYTKYSLKKGQKLTNALNILWERMIHKVR